MSPPTFSPCHIMNRSSARVMDIVLDAARKSSTLLANKLHWQPFYTQPRLRPAHGSVTIKIHADSLFLGPLVYIRLTVSHTRVPQHRLNRRRLLPPQVRDESQKCLVGFTASVVGASCGFAEEKCPCMLATGLFASFFHLSRVFAFRGFLPIKLIERTFPFSFCPSFVRVGVPPVPTRAPSPAPSPAPTPAPTLSPTPGGDCNRNVGHIPSKSQCFLPPSLG